MWNSFRKHGVPQTCRSLYPISKRSQERILWRAISKSRVLEKSILPKSSIYPIMSFNLPYIIQTRYYSTTQERELREITNYPKLLLLLQSGKYDELCEDIKKKYTEGYYLSKKDLSSILRNFTEYHRYDLTNALYQILKENHSDYCNEFAPLFCYNYILSGNLQKAFSLLTSASDSYLAIKKQEIENQPQSKSRVVYKPLLPQEYLFVRLCIQLMANVSGVSGVSTSWFPRKSKDIEFAKHSQSIVSNYLFTWEYLTTALSYKTQHSFQDSSQDSSQEFSQEPSQEPSQDSPHSLRAFFANPYSPIVGNTKSLNSHSFSSFTFRFCEQRLESTQRSLELLLWYYYSRSVFDLDKIVIQEKEEALTFTETIDMVFHSMKKRVDLWNKGIFQFFIFYYSQPVFFSKKIAGKLVKQSRMKDGEIVSMLLNEMKKKNYSISPILTQMLMLKPDISPSMVSLLISFFIDRSISPSQLQSFLQHHESLIVHFSRAFVKKNAISDFQAFVDGLLYLNVSLSSETLNQILIHVCSLEEDESVSQMVNQVKHIQKAVSVEALSSQIAHRLYHNHSIDDLLKEINVEEAKWQLMLSHLLVHFHSFKSTSTTTSAVLQFVDFCKSHEIGSSGNDLERVFAFYKENNDYKSILKLHSYVKEKKLAVNSSFIAELEEMVMRINQSQSRLFGNTHILDQFVYNDKKWLPRANSKFDLNASSLKQATAILRSNEQSVSVNTLLESIVKEFCESSMLKYDLWL